MRLKCVIQTKIRVTVTHFAESGHILNKLRKLMSVSGVLLEEEPAAVASAASAHVLEIISDPFSFSFHSKDRSLVSGKT